MITAIACTAQILGLGAFVFGYGSFLDDNRSPIAGPLIGFACVCAVITYICERIVA